MPEVSGNHMPNVPDSSTDTLYYYYIISNVRSSKGANESRGLFLTLSCKVETLRPCMDKDASRHIDFVAMILATAVGAHAIFRPAGPFASQERCRIPLRQEGYSIPS